MRFRNIIEAKTLYAWIDAQGNLKRVSSDFTMTNPAGVSLAVTNLQWLVSQVNVQTETGNSGTKHYYEYMKARFIAASAKAKNNKEFSDNLNKLFGTNKFTDKKLF